MFFFFAENKSLINNMVQNLEELFLHNNCSVITFEALKPIKQETCLVEIYFCIFFIYIYTNMLLFCNFICTPIKKKNKMTNIWKWKMRLSFKILIVFTSHKMLVKNAIIVSNLSRKVFKGTNKGRRVKIF